MRRSLCPQPTKQTYLYFNKNDNWKRGSQDSGFSSFITLTTTGLCEVFGYAVYSSVWFEPLVKVPASVNLFNSQKIM